MQSSLLKAQKHNNSALVLQKFMLFSNLTQSVHVQKKEKGFSPLFHPLSGSLRSPSCGDKCLRCPSVNTVSERLVDGVACVGQTAASTR